MSGLGGVLAAAIALPVVAATGILVRNTSDKFDLGSRFCNKIWQVANFFVIANLKNIPPEPVDESAPRRGH